MIGIRFDDPLWLWALLLVPVVVGVAWHAASTRQLRIATILRAIGVAALVLALAGPRIDASGDRVDVAFLVDRSDSVGVNGDASDDIDAALGTRDGDDRAAVAVFGRDSRVEQSLTDTPSSPDFSSVVDGSATDLARALRLAQGVLGSESRRRVVVYTDGRQTSGDAIRAAEELAAAGIRVDVVPVASGESADVLVTAVRAPGQLREGEAFDVVATLTNTGGDPAEVEVITDADGVEIDRRVVTAGPGETQVAVPQVADESGAVRFEVRIATSSSSVPQNDVGRTAVQVAGPPKVLVLEGESGSGEALAAALDATGVPVDLRDGETNGFPTLDAALGYDSIVLVDVPADLLGDAGMQVLDTYVRDAGRGLVAIGGDDAYGMGDYDGTPLEELLPVFARIRDQQRRPSVAEALVVDVSGSMAACHCREEGFAGGGDPMTGEGGINKTDITKEAVARAIDALASDDTVGVLAFNAEAKWVLPLQQVPSQAIVDNALSRLHPDGPTDVVNALDQAIAGLKDVDARLRHIVLFTDGFSEDPRMVAAASRAMEAGITLSVVATGEGTGEVLERMAEAGGGRFYPGRDLASIPDIIVNEVQIAARPLISEGVFTPVITASAPAVDDLTEAPPLLGYVATTEKPTARTILRIGDQNDPLLASWQAGAGTAVAWTSDAQPRWSQQWVTWDGYAGFWSDVVRSTFPVAGDGQYTTSAAVTGDGVSISVDAQAAVPEGTTGSATITDPDGNRTSIPLERTDLDQFGVTVPGSAEGVYGVTVELTGPDGEVVHRESTTAIRTYSAEYALRIDDAGFLAQLAAAGGGEVDLDPERVFDPEGLERGRSTRAWWGWLALLALLTIPADIGLRRLRVEKGDLRKFLPRRREGAHEPAGMPPPMPWSGTRPPAPPPPPSTDARPTPPPPRRAAPPPPAPGTRHIDDPDPPPPPGARREGQPPAPASRLLDARRQARDP